MTPSACSNRSRNEGPLCRFCNRNDKAASTLISPCERCLHCRGTVAVFHAMCYKKWLKTNKKLVCRNCLVSYERVREFKKISEWTWPRPVSYDLQGLLEVASIIIFIYKLFTTGPFFIRNICLEVILITLGDFLTIRQYLIISIYLYGLWFAAKMCVGMMMAIVETWIQENTIHTFKMVKTA